MNVQAPSATQWSEQGASRSYPARSGPADQGPASAKRENSDPNRKRCGQMFRRVNACASALRRVVRRFALACVFVTGFFLAAEIRPVPTYAATEALLTVHDSFVNQAEHWDGVFRLVRQENTVTATVSVQRSSMQYQLFARQQPEALFTVPAGFRPAEPIIREITGAQVVDVAGRVQEVPVQRFDLRIMPDGAVHYVDNEKADGLGYLRYAATLAWTVGAACGDSPLHGRTPELVASLVRHLRLSTCADVLSGDLAALTYFRPLNLIALQTGDFAGLDNLQHLNLSGNQLRTLPEGLLTELPQLIALNLEGNRLSALPADIFAGANLNRLNLAYNQLTVLPRTLPIWLAPARRQSLNLAYNQLTVLPPGAFTNAVIGALDLRYNQLTVLPPGAFTDTNIGTLDLRHNQLRTLTSGLFVRSRIRQLDLADNHLSELPPDAFAGLTGLYRLDLSHNQLTTLPTSLFAQFGQLRFLYLFDNHLRLLPSEAFAGLGLLNALILHGNQLRSLPVGLFAGLGALRYLDVHDNPLSCLHPDAFLDQQTSLSSLHPALEINRNPYFGGPQTDYYYRRMPDLGESYLYFCPN